MYTKVHDLGAVLPRRLWKSRLYLPCGYRIAVCSQAALEKQLNTTARGFREIYENSKLLCEK
jgi:hypothetical protein